LLIGHPDSGFFIGRRKQERKQIAVAFFPGAPAPYKKLKNGI
jgi:hypothetical protein